MRARAARASAGIVLALALFPQVAEAQTKQACADAYVAGQVARKEGRLRDARARFQVCAASACPAQLQPDCDKWRGQLDGEIPTMAVSVVDGDGASVSGATITVDGQPLGVSTSFDPGDHTVRVEAPGKPARTQVVTLVAGDHPKRVTVRLDAGAPVPASSEGRPLPIAPIVIGGVGVVGLALFAGLGAAGNSKKSALDALGCKPDCSPSDVSSAKSLYIGADVGLGIGLAALVTAGVLFAIHVKGSPPPASAARFVMPTTDGVRISF